MDDDLYLEDAIEYIDRKYMSSSLRPFPVPLITKMEFDPKILVQALEAGKDIDISQNYPSLLNDQLRRKKYDLAIKLMPAYPVGYRIEIFVFYPIQILRQLMERFNVSVVTNYTTIDDLVRHVTIDMIMNSIDNINEFNLPPLSILFSPKYILLLKYYALLQIPIDVRLKTEVSNIIVDNPVMYGLQIHNPNNINDRLKSALNDGRIDEARRLFNEGG